MPALIIEKTFADRLRLILGDNSFTDRIWASRYSETFRQTVGETISRIESQTGRYGVVEFIRPEKRSESGKTR